MTIARLHRPGKPFRIGWTPGVRGARLGPGFMAVCALAQVGAFVAFIPLLQILAPLKAGALDPLHKTALLSRVVFLGAVGAAVANLAAGALGDRTRRRLGRRPWMIAGLAGVVVAYAVIAGASGPWALVGGVVLFQVLFNVFFSAFNAAVAERTPDAQKGMVFSLLSLGLPLGSVTGFLLVGDMVHGERARFAALGAVVLAAILPFVLTLKEGRRPEREAAPANDAGRPWLTADFAWAICGRIPTLTAHNVLQAFALFILEDRWSHLGRAPGASDPEQALANLLALVTCANVASALFCGWLSDRVGRRKPFVCLGALGSGAALALCGMAHSWAAVIPAFVLFGCAAGCYYAVDNAMVVQVLPSLDNAGRDLGVVNLTNTIPQALAPLLAAAVMHGAHGDYGRLFLIAAALTALGAAAVLPIRGVR